MRKFQSLKKFSNFVLENESMNLQEALKKIEDLEVKIEELTDELTDANQELEDTKSELDTMGWDKQALVDEVDELKGVQKELEELQDNYDEIVLEKNDLQGSYDQLENEKEEMERRLETLDALEEWDANFDSKNIEKMEVVYDFLGDILNVFEDYPLEMAKVYQDDPRKIMDRVLNPEIVENLKSKGASLLNRFE
jgi:chromosome segregation ATPase